MISERATGSWNLVFASVAGTAHRSGICQDHSEGRVLDISTGPVLIAAVADGAGSASHSDQGARAAVTAFLSAAETELAVTPSETITEEQVRSWVEIARHQVECLAEKQGVPLRQMACTFLAAIVGPTSVWCVQIGDGLIVFDGLVPERYAFAFWPDSGEYVNTTRFLTDEDYKTRCRYDRLISHPTNHLALLTDGLQMLALDYAAALIYAPFFAPLFAAVTGSTDSSVLEANLQGFLNSPRVNDRTDDDKTLLLATRHPVIFDWPSHPATNARTDATV